MNRSELLQLLDELRDHSQEDPPEDYAEPLERDAETAKREDRSRISRWVVATFLFLVATLVLYILTGHFFHEAGWEAARHPAEYAATTIGLVLLPVVTLVLGCYFGTST